MWKAIAERDFIRKLKQDFEEIKVSLKRIEELLEGLKQDKKK